MSGNEIDQNALSRQLAVYGHEVQAKLMSMRVLIHGITGLGVEVAKNLILAGPKQVTLHDPTPVAPEDLGRNFYVREEHVGKVTRAHASLKDLSELNPNVKVVVAQEASIHKMVQDNDCVVVLDNFDKKFLVELDEACRAKGVGFIYGGNLGLYGFTFVDFGDKHKVFDTNGEQEKSIHIEVISQEKEGVVYLHENKKHGFSDGDVLSFREVQGMNELNGQQRAIKVITSSSFSIGDTSTYSQYINGGIATQVKVPVLQKFHPLSVSLNCAYAPGEKELPICNWDHLGYPEQLHVILNGLLVFWSRHGRLPGNLSAEDCGELESICKQWLGTKIQEEGFEFKLDQLDKDLIRNVSMFSNTQISPLCSFWGGIITQEVIKLTGKYSPLRQWLHHECFEILDKDHFINSPQRPQFSYLNTRYRDYNILFGNKLVERVSKCNAFLIGAGALGCEFIKMFSLMGFAREEGGRVLCTDDDNIEISNLNRQFLFRKHHVGRNKSEVACSIGKTINQACRLQSVQVKVNEESQDYFNEAFWEGLDIVVNAVDNIKARQYIDDKCVWFEKPLFESGTLGTKCHSQIVIPHQTISYKDLRDPPEEEFAVCTVKLFPYQIEHTIQWAREYFESVVAIPSQDLSKFYQEKNQYLDKIVQENKLNLTIAKERIKKISSFHEINSSRSYLRCVEYTVRLFEQAFQNQIAQLLHTFPADYVNSKTGMPYWSGYKRCPTVIKVDTHDKRHVEFIQAAANIIAKAFGIEEVRDPEEIKKLIKQIKPQEFVPKKVKVDAEAGNSKDIEVEFLEQDEQELNKIIQYLSGLEIKNGTKIEQIVFEKDDPTNWHIEFMSSVANLRARNYRIDEVDNFKVKLIAGKIIPAIATATALIVGAVGIEIIKYLLHSDHKAYKQGYFNNITVNLAIPLLVMNEPLPANTIADSEFDVLMGGPVKAIPKKFTKWDKIEVRGPKTLRELKQGFEQEWDVQIGMITHNDKVVIYKGFGPEAKQWKHRLDMSLEQVYVEATKKKIPPGKKSLSFQIQSSEQNGVDCLIPYIKYYLQ